MEASITPSLVEFDSSLAHAIASDKVDHERRGYEVVVFSGAP
jgi:hypothetical protein